MDVPSIPWHDFSWDRMIAAVEDVRLRASRAASALRQAEVPFVVVGGHAVASWVARVDREAVRNTKDVDLLVRREDFSQVVEALQTAGFVHQSVADVDVFLDGPHGSVRSGIHILFAGEMVRPRDVIANPDVTDSEPGPDFPVPTLEALVRMKLNSFRLKDKVHLLDLLEMGLLDGSWCGRLPAELAARLGEVMETRERER